MQINVKNPKFLLAVLKDEVLNRTQYMVTQGIAYDESWRGSFVELFQVIEQLESLPGEKLDEEPLTTPTFDKLVSDDDYLDRDPIPNRERVGRVENPFPVGTEVLIGKGKTVWEVIKHSPGDLHVVVRHVNTTGNARHASPLITQLKKA